MPRCMERGAELRLISEIDERVCAPIIDDDLPSTVGSSIRRIGSVAIEKEGLTNRRREIIPLDESLNEVLSSLDYPFSSYKRSYR